MQKTIDTDPAMVEAIARGAAKATLYAQTNPDCARQIHWKNFPSTKPTGADEPRSPSGTWRCCRPARTMKSAQDMNGGKFIGAMTPPPSAACRTSCSRTA
jgi:NitT/TauT family transport system substrate-binding protein